MNYIIKRKGVLQEFPKLMQPYKQLLFLASRINKSFSGPYILSDLWEYHFEIFQMKNIISSSTKSGTSVEFFPLSNRLKPQFNFPILKIQTRDLSDPEVEKWFGILKFPLVLKTLNDISTILQTQVQTKNALVNNLIKYEEELLKLINIFKSYTKNLEIRKTPNFKGQ